MKVSNSNLDYDRTQSDTMKTLKMRNSINEFLSYSERIIMKIIIIVKKMSQ